MFANPTFVVGTLQRVVAILVACAVLLWSIGVNTTAQAANLTSISDTVSTSDPLVTASHTIAFTIPTGSGLADTDTITIDFSDGPFGGVGTLITTDIAVTVEGSGDAHANFAAGASSISFDGITAAADEEVIVAIADGKITNPATSGQSYEIVVDTGATTTDTGKTRVAIVDTVLVTAVVETTFDFTVSGLATSTTFNGTTTTGSTTATEIPFGVLEAGQVKTLAQRLNVATNAYGGFVVTVEQDGPLLSSTGADIDSFFDDTDLDTPGIWQAPGNTLGNEWEYGHWGITSSDSDLNAGEFTGTKYVAASTTPRVIFSHNSVSDGVANDIGSTTVGYSIEITPLQEAADDYNTTLTYIATPTF